MKHGQKIILNYIPVYLYLYIDKIGFCEKRSFIFLVNAL